MLYGLNFSLSLLPLMASVRDRKVLIWQMRRFASKPAGETERENPPRVYLVLDPDALSEFRGTSSTRNQYRTFHARFVPLIKQEWNLAEDRFDSVKDGLSRSGASVSLATSAGGSDPICIRITCRS